MKTVKAKTLRFGRNPPHAYTKTFLKSGNNVISYTSSRRLRSYVCFADWKNFKLQQKMSKYANNKWHKSK